VEWVELRFGLGADRWRSAGLTAYKGLEAPVKIKLVVLLG
jgi:hypothetical protein